MTRAAPTRSTRPPMAARPGTCLENSVKRSLLVWLISLSLAGCSAAPPQPSVVPTVASDTGQPGTSLTAEQVKNMKVTLVASNEHQTVQLANGEYKNGMDPMSTDCAAVSLLDQPIAFGDLNGDGQVDAAALLAENYGGTGVFVSVIAILNSGGQPVQAGASMIDDRPRINLLAVRDGQILLAGSVHGPDDPGCCAALPVSQVFGLIQ